MRLSAGLSQPGSLLWFARFEARLAWRDALSMLTAGRIGRQRKLALGLIGLSILLHGVAYLVLRFVTGEVRPDLQTLVIVTAGIVLSGSAMLAQAMESVTRIFYARSDLELILSAPVQAGKLFAVRIAAMALGAAGMSILVLGPFINVLAWRGGAQWLGGYLVLVAVAIATTSIAVALTVLLFRLMGPVRTRLLAQIAAAVIGGMFVIGLQVAAMLSAGTPSRFVFLSSPFLLAHVPDIDSVLWYPARAAMGDLSALAVVAGGTLALFLATTAHYAPRFADYTLTAVSGGHASSAQKRNGERPFRVVSPSATLRLKERRLLLRDPWLISQSLMQLLYLVPPGILLWLDLGRGATASIVLVPILIMTAGQLAGGLAWITVSGEDAPDLVLSAPLTPARLLRAKIEAVMQSVGIVLLPFVAVLSLISVQQALIVALGSAAAAASSTAIQLWFRSQSKRSHFRRRHTSSRIATLSEALVSITWAGAGTVFIVSTPLALVMVVIALVILACVRALSPRRAA